MAHASCRILVVDSSVVRAQALCGIFAKAKWEIWAGRNVRDALVLAGGLTFDVVLVHESSTQQHPELWEQLAEWVAGACWLVHAEDAPRGRSKLGCGVLESDPALILAVLMLLVEQGPAVGSCAQAA
jgi:hypothetical protein